MSVERGKGRDAVDEVLARGLRSVPLARPLPRPRDDEPTDHDLLLLLDGGLDPARQAEVEARLRCCPFSADRLDVLREALHEEQRARLSPDEQPASPSRLARLVFAVAKDTLRFLRGTDLPVALGPALATTRSANVVAPADEDYYYRFTRCFGEWDAVIQIESVPRAGMELRIEISRAGQPLDDARAALRRDGKLLESVRLRGGIAGFAGLRPDHYEVAVTRNGTEIGQLTLEFLEG
jgi:hypothetical protein